MNLALRRRLRPPKHVLFQELAGEAVLVDLDSGESFALNEVGTRMWLALTESDSVQEAYEVLLTEYGVDPEMLRQDMDILIEELLSLGLLELQEQH